jgi:hypothetical protein
MQSTIASWESGDLEEPDKEEDEAQILDRPPKSAFELNVERTIGALGTTPCPAAHETSLLEEVRH